MTTRQIEEIIAHGRFPGEKAPAELVETHISWVILTPSYAFKIKKPLQFPFLDFSTLAKRELYCQEELRLNRRLAPDLYLDVLPIGKGADRQPAIGELSGSPVDFAVQMKRMDGRRRMDLMLERHEVTPADMMRLSHLLVPFHRTFRLAPEEVPWRPGDNRRDFDDLFRMKNVASALLGEEALTEMDRWEKQIHRFLDRHESRLHERATSGFWVDGHGDLHARNIFLLPDAPVVFDCIEFNVHLRQIDVLSELAFLCMELEAVNQYELAAAFLTAYLRGWRVITCDEDEFLWIYFKAYRANVRLKVELMRWEQQKTTETEENVRLYWSLVGHYLVQLDLDRAQGE